MGGAPLLPPVLVLARAEVLRRESTGVHLLSQRPPSLPVTALIYGSHYELSCAGTSAGLMHSRK
eukprot:COSAG01_NODE_2484_length_7600_cov_2.596587_10_plen_64_part_00